MVRAIIWLMLFILSGCGADSGGGAGSQAPVSAGSTQVTISLGQAVETGAIGAPGVVPANIQSMSVEAIGANGLAIPGAKAVGNAPALTVTLSVSNGNGIKFKVLAFDAANAGGNKVYEGLSAAQNLTGTAVTVPVKMNLSVVVSGTLISSDPVTGVVVFDLYGWVAGAPPLATSPLLWSLPPGQGTLGTPTANGATVRWTSPQQAGTYTITAQVDTAVNTSQDLGITDVAVITVTDGIKPVITMLGTSPYTIPAGTAYVDVGAKATDNFDGNITAKIIATSTVNTAVPGTYTVAYNVSDVAGNAAVPMVRTVVVQDVTPPVVTAPANITVAAVNANGTPATDAAITAFLNGVIATDNVGVVSLLNNAPAQFPLNVTTTVTFTAADAAGLTNVASATVTVADQTAPVIANVPAALTINSPTSPVPVADAQIQTFLAAPTATDNVDGVVAVTNNAPTSFSIGTTPIIFSAVDAAGKSASLTSSITIVSNNLNPVAVADSYTTAEDTPVTVPDVLLNDSDPNLDPLSIAAADTVSANGGTVTNHGNGTFGYTSALNFNGTDTFTYTVSDGKGGTAIGTVTITVTPVNDAPVPTAPAITTAEAVAGTSTVAPNDPDAGDTHTFAVTTPAANGTATIDVYGVVNYTPNAFFNGTDSFTITVTDAGGLIGTVTILATVTPVNNAPVPTATPTAPTLLEDTYSSVSIVPNDPDVGDTHTFTITAPANIGVATVDTYGMVNYVPNANANGGDAFIVMVTDAGGLSGTVSVPLTITPVNDAPVPIAPGITMASGISGTSMVAPNDPDIGDTHTYAVTTPAANGTAVVDLYGGVTYTSNAAFSGVDSFSITVTDAGGLIGMVTISATVSDQTPPVISLLGNNPYVVPLNSTFTDPGSIVTDNVSTGLVATVAGTVNTAISATYTLTYSAVDAANNAAASVTRTVIVNSVPVAGLFTTSFQEGMNGYIGSRDTELRQDLPDLSFGNAAFVSIDGSDDGNSVTGMDSLALMRFDHIVGALPGQIPAGAVVQSALLQSFVISGGDSVDMRQMAVAWDEYATWNSMSANAKAAPLSQTLIGRAVSNVADANPLGTSGVFQSFDVYSDVQAWVNGTANNGWAFVPNNPLLGDGVDFATREALLISDRPLLQVSYLSQTLAARTAPNTNITLTLDGVDALAQPLTAIVQSIPANGMLYQTADGITPATAILTAPTPVTDVYGRVIYVPNVAFAGTDAFGFVVNNGVLDSTPATLTIHVDTTAPVMTLNGTDPYVIAQGQAYADAGATATDNVDGNLTTSIIVNNPVNTAVPGNYVVTYQVTDAANNSALMTRTVKVNAAPVAGVQQATFQNGVNGYAGVQDTELNESTPATVLGLNPTVTIDGGFDLLTATTDTYAMLRFGNMIGTAQGQVPLGAMVVDATMDLYVTSGGDHVDVVQLFSNWDQATATWATDSAKVTAGTFLTRIPGRPIAGTPLNLSFAPQSFNVTPVVQSWASGAANFGLGFRPFSTLAQDGADFATSESLTYPTPALHVQYIDPYGNIYSTGTTTLNLSGFDANGDVLTARVSGLPVNGVLYQTTDGVTPGNAITVANTVVTDIYARVIYVPNNPAIPLPDSLQYVVNDGLVDSAVATFNLQLSNLAPAITSPADPYALTVAEDSYANFTVLATDPNGDPMTWDIYSAAANGTATVDLYGHVSYIGNLNYNGADSFGVRVSDPYGAATLLSVNVTVTPVNDAPTLNISPLGPWGTPEDTPLPLTAVGNDVDGDPLTYLATINPANGVLALDIYTGAMTYAPNANWFGPDVMQVDVSDGYTTAGPIDIYVMVSPVNDAPYFTVPVDHYATPGNPYSMSVTNDIPASFTVGAFDIEGDAYSYSLSVAPLHGVATVDAYGVVTYTSPAPYTGPDSFTVRVTDIYSAFDNLLVNVNVTGPNVAPVITSPLDPYSISVAVNGAATFTVSATDANVGDTLSFDIYSMPSQGGLATVDPYTGMVSYSPYANFSGLETFAVRVTDSGGLSAVVNVRAAAGALAGINTNLEADNGTFIATGSWQWGDPYASGPGYAASGTNVWATNLAGNYPHGMNDTLTLPLVDLAGKATPIFSFRYWVAGEGTLDYLMVEATTDGVVWNRINPVDKAYDNGNNTGWSSMVARKDYSTTAFDLSAFAGQSVRLRLRFISNGCCIATSGAYVDDFYVGDNVDVDADGITVLGEAQVDSNPIASDVYTGVNTTLETDNGGFFASGSWQWGDPYASGPLAAASGSKVWATNLAGSYGHGEDSHLILPAIDLYGMAKPVFSFRHWVSGEGTLDYLSVEVLTQDGYTSWTRIDPTDLAYDNGSTGWSNVFDLAGHTVRQRYSTSVFDLSPFAGKAVRLRLRFISNGCCIASSGAYVDDFYVGDDIDVDGDNVSVSLEAGVDSNPIVNDIYTGVNTTLEADDGGFFPSGSWQWGDPYASGPQAAASGVNVWATNLAGNYGNSEDSQLILPAVDLYGMASPVFSFRHHVGGEGTLDYLSVEILTQDTYTSWTRIYPADLAYDNGSTGWSNKFDLSGHTVRQRYITSVFDLSPFRNKSVRLRLRFISNGCCIVNSGAYVDDFYIGDDIDVDNDGVIVSNEADVDSSPIINDIVTVVSADLEAGNGNFFPSGSWAWGAPTSGPAAATSGTNVWATNLTGNYGHLEDSQLILPVVNLYGQINPVLSFRYWVSGESIYDYLVLEVLSQDGYTAWTRINPMLASYDNISGTGWSSQTIAYKTALFDLTSFAGKAVRARLRFISNGCCVASSGAYVDDFHVSENGDLDADGATDYVEALHGSDPWNPDTDGDGLTDGLEINTYGTNPLVTDSDGDGLTDGDEVNIHGTNPAVADTDGDGALDGLEITAGTNPLDPLSSPLGATIVPGTFLSFEDVYGGGLYTPGLLWQHGVPTSGPSIAYSGTSLWATNLTGNTGVSDREYLYLPTIDLYTSPNPTLSMRIWAADQWAWKVDGTTVEVFDVASASWLPVDPYVLPYDSTNIAGLGLNGWTNQGGTSDQFFRFALFKLNAYSGQKIQIRFAYRSNAAQTASPGAYIDDVRVNDELSDVDADGIAGVINEWFATFNGTVGADPFVADSDGDGALDGVDSAPLNPAVGFVGAHVAVAGEALDVYAATDGTLWQYGMPASGPNRTSGMTADPYVWATNLAGNTGVLDREYLYLPLLDLYGTANPTLSMRIWAADQWAWQVDGTTVEVFDTATSSWLPIDPYILPYDAANIAGIGLNGWTNQGWTSDTFFRFAAFDLTAYSGQQIQVRYAYRSNEAQTASPGSYIDEIRLDSEAVDADADGVAGVINEWFSAFNGTVGSDPFVADTDGDGTVDGVDTAPLNPAVGFAGAHVAVVGEALDVYATTNGTLWQYGVPVSGPNAASGITADPYVWATNLAGNTGVLDREYLYLSVLDLYGVVNPTLSMRIWAADQWAWKVDGTTVEVFDTATSNWLPIDPYILPYDSANIAGLGLSGWTNQGGAPNQFFSFAAFDLTAYSGQQIQVRYAYRSNDAQTASPGAYIDEIRLDSEAVDADGDGIAGVINEWYSAGTDPFIADTDGDGTVDGIDTAPLNPAVGFIGATAFAPGGGMLDMYAVTSGTLWQYGAPVSGPNATAGITADPYVWATNLAGNYINSADEYLYLPLLDLYGTANPTLSLRIWSNAQAPWDGTNVEALVGGVWTIINPYITPYEGMQYYNAAFPAWNSQAWNTSAYVYALAAFDLTVYSGQQLQLRLAFRSDPANVTGAGAYVDEIRLDSEAVDADADGINGVLNEWRTTGADPFVTDTDGDGTPDGADGYPLNPAAGYPGAYIAVVGNALDAYAATDGTLWQYGVPVSGPNAAAGITADPYVWATNLAANYINSANESVYLPILDLVGTLNPTLSLRIWSNAQSPWDGTNVEAFVGGAWVILDPYMTPYDGMQNYNALFPAWNLQNTGYALAAFDLTAYSAQQLQVRVTFRSDPANVTGPGAYVDELRLDTEASDPDGDGIAGVLNEWNSTFNSVLAKGTDPFKFDTDGDGISDGQEVANNSDPLSATSTNGVPVAGLNMQGGALLFDGVNDYVDIPGNWGGPTWTQGTFEAWIRQDGNNGVLSAVLSSDGYGFVHLQTGPAGQTGVFFDTDPYATGQWPTVPSVSLGQWHHLALSAQSGATNVYVDGQLFSTSAATYNYITQSLGLFSIGRGYLNGRYFTGAIDEVRIWSAARTQAQIQADMYTALTGAEAGLVGYWGFNAGVDVYTADGTINANHGWMGGGVAASVPVLIASGISTLNSAATVTMQPDTYATLWLSGKDAENDPLTINVATLPSQGTLWQTLNGADPYVQITTPGTQVSDPYGRVIFIPAVGSTGVPYATFDFTVSDPYATSTAATVTVDVRSPVVIAAANGNNNISGANCNTVWNLAGSPYWVQSDVTVGAGCSLQIDAGVIVKMDPARNITGTGSINVYGQLGSEVYITSIYDDTVGGDTNGDGGVTTPTAGNWNSFQGSMLNLDYLVSRYGAYGAKVNPGTSTLNHLTISDTNIGLYMVGSTAADTSSIANVSMSNIAQRGIYLQSTTGNADMMPVFTNISIRGSGSLQAIALQNASGSSVIAPVFNGVNNISWSTTAAAALWSSGAGVNVTMSGTMLSGGSHSAYFAAGASGTFTSNTLSGAANEAVYMTGGSMPTMDSSNTIANANAAYMIVGQGLSTGLAASIDFASMVDPYAVHLSGTLSNTTAVFGPDPLGSGSTPAVIDPYDSVWRIMNGHFSIASNARMQIDAGTVFKLDTNLAIYGTGVLDVYGAPGNEVVFTSINDDAYGAAVNGSTGAPATGKWNYLYFSAGTMQYAKVLNGAGVSISSGTSVLSNVTIADSAFSGLTVSGTASPTISNLTIQNTASMGLVVSTIGNPVFNGVNISGASGNGISVTGSGSNISFNNVMVNGGTNAVYMSNGKASFTNSQFTGSTAEAISLVYPALLTMDGTNSINGGSSPYLLSNMGLQASVSPVIGAVADPYSVHLTGNISTPIALAADPLGTGNSQWLLNATTTINAGGVVDIYAGAIIKSANKQITVASGGILNIQGSVGNPVVMTSINDDAVGSVVPGSTGTPAAGSGFSLAYNSGSAGTINYLECRNARQVSVSQDGINLTGLKITNTNKGLIVSSLAAGQPITNMTITDLYVENTSTTYLDHALTLGGAVDVLSPTFVGATTIIKPKPFSTTSTYGNAVYVNGTNANVTLNGFSIIGGTTGVETVVANAVTITNSVVEGAITGVHANTGVMLNMSNNAVRSNLGYGISLKSAGVSSINGNAIVNNGGGIKVAGPTDVAGTVVENNLIRGILGVGGVNMNALTVSSNAVSALTVRNNLFAENKSGGALSVAGAVHVFSNTATATGPTVDLYSNTIAHNTSGGAAIPAGLVVDAYAMVNAFDNIFAFNTDSVSAISDVLFDAQAIVSESNNLTTDNTLVGVGDVYADPLFDSNWYLQAASPAVNVGSMLAAGAPFIATNPYAQVAITDTGNLDLGGHRNAPSATVSATLSTVTPASYLNPGNGVVPVYVTPKDALGNNIGVGLRVTASLGASVTGAVIGSILDLGDGSYQVNVDGTAATLGQADVVTISVEGAGLVTPLTATTSITW